MKIFIQARKNGYNVLYPTPTPDEFYQFASDIQSASASNDAKYYGKNFYTLAFASDGCIFSKYVIGYDVQRSYIGNIGISVFIPNTKKLSGSNIKELLDKLLNLYCNNYCPDNYLKSDKREDWNLFTSIANSYDEKLSSRTSNYTKIITGTKNPAFHYYKSDNELIEHFDKPFQEEYSDYKQIYFISSNLQFDANPLDLLVNSGDEVNPDLENEYYYLNNYNTNKGVKISAYYNNKWNDCYDKKIRAKWKVEIKYSKDYYETFVATGSILDKTSDIHEYIEINENNIRIKYDAFQPTPKTKTVTFNVVTKKDGKEVTDAEIQVDTQPWKHLTEITFSGEELGIDHKFAARKGDNLFSDVKKIPREKYSEDTIPLEFQLIEKRVVKIKAIDKESGADISNFKLWCNDNKGYRENVTEITFLDDDIYKKWNIEVSKKEGRDNYSGKVENYQPATGKNPLCVECQKTTDVQPIDNTYKIDAGKHGKKADNCPDYSSSSTGNDLDKNCIIANKGYVFNNKWELQNETLVAQYEKQKSFSQKAKTFFSKPAGIATLIIIALGLGVSIWALCYFLGNDKQPKENLLTAQKITAYVEGDSLMLNKLNAYKQEWKKQEQNFITKQGGGIFGGEEKADSTKWKNDWKPAYESINRAIDKRTKINEKKFGELKHEDFKRSEQQRNFIKTIREVDSTKYAEIYDQLGDVSALTLTQIADSINSILTPRRQEEKAQLQEPKKEEKKKAQKGEPEYITNYLERSSEFQLDSIKTYYGVMGLSNDLNNSLRLVKNFISRGYKNCENFTRKASKDKFLKENQNLKRWVNKVCKDSQNISKNQAHSPTEKNSKIIQYINGSELDKAKLEEYKNTEGVNSDLKNSIQLCLDFWELDGMGNGKRAKTYWSLREKVNKDSYLKSSKLKVFLDKMCEKGANSSYSKIDKKRGLK